MANKLLLTSVCRPFGGPGEGDSVGAELFHAQVTRAQGPFSLRQTIRVWALDYIAENLATPTVTLHYPSKRVLIAAVKSGGYTHVGINFVVATFHKVREMVTLIRRHAPNANVVLGGYGTVLPDDVLRPWGDSICREEGTVFMRRLLGEPVDAPVRHPHAPIPSPSVLASQTKSFVGHVTAGLGCPNGCDFCCTSHFFDRKYVRYAETGADIYEAMLATRRRSVEDGQNMSSFILIDEDFFMHHRRARQFLHCVRDGGEYLSIMGFGSVAGLSKFTKLEIAEMGFEVIWNAFEGTNAGYGKQKGRPMPELYADLQSIGCGTLTSMIIGFPYQNEATIRAEFDQLMALEPSMVQCLIYFAFPGTPFHKQVISEKRYLPQYQDAPDLRRWDGFAMHFDHPQFDGPERVEALQKELYREDFRRLGPTPLRSARTWLTGYENLRGHSNPLLAQRAEVLRGMVRHALPATSSAILFAPSRQARERAIALRRDILRVTGKMTAAERAADTGAPLAYLAVRAARKLGLLQQPGLLRTEHRTGTGAGLHTKDSRRLQGNRFSGLSGALADDAREALGRVASALGWDRTPAPPPVLNVVTNRTGDMPRSYVDDQRPPCAASA
jgi:hypothetical protein